MKRILIIVLSMLLVLSLCACGEKAEETKTLRVGFGREEITPQGPILIAGGGNDDRISTGILDYLYVTCVAITDTEGNTALILTQDTVSSSEDFSITARESISKATGVPFENIIIGATHTHSSGKLLGNATGVPEFTANYFSKIVSVAQKAMEDRSPATVAMGNTRAEDLVFVRRYQLDDGTIKGARGNMSTSTTIVGHVWEANDTLQIVRFTRADKKDIILTGLGAHATFNGSTTQTNLSADYPAGIRDYLEYHADCLVAHFIGAAGDQTPTTDIREEKHRMNYFAYGERIGEIVYEFLPKLQPVAEGKIRVTTQTLTAESKKDDPTKVTEAKKLWDLFQKEGFATAEKAAKEAGYAGIYDARAVVNHATLPPSRDIIGTVIALGDMAFTAMPYEMHGGSARELVESSAFGEKTFVITCANGAEGYIPDARGYEIGTYEAYTSYVVPGTGEKLVEMYLEMLSELKGQ